MSENNTLKFTGTAIHVGEIVEVSDRFSKREVAFEVGSGPDGKYPQQLLVVFSNSKIELAETIEVGKTYEVCFNLNGKEGKPGNDGQRRWYTNLSGWRVSEVSSARAQPAPTPAVKARKPATREYQF